LMYVFLEGMLIQMQLKSMQPVENNDQQTNMGK
jgi:hypothetical protein